MSKIKPYEIPKQLVWDSYLKVKANKGAAGIDNVTIQKYEENLKDNLYKLWNRMSSGSYFPKPVKAVAIPKDNGEERVLGIPTVEDRIAQTVVVQILEPEVEPLFHKDSYGYRPNKSALDAVATARERCWRQNWVIDLDIQSFFDSIDHELMMRTVRKHIDIPWMLLYIERWLKAPMQKCTGELVTRDKGTPQGGVCSPLLANIFMHHVFDDWLAKELPNVKFERYVDDAIVHCSSKKQAEFVLEMIRKRLERCKLQLHSEKTKIIYCKDTDRKEDVVNIKFDFLGFTFRPRLAKNKYGKHFVNFLPAISNRAKNKMQKMIKQWRLHLITWTTLENMAEKINPIMRGWVQYYGRFYKSELYKPLRNVERYLILWARKKFKKLSQHGRNAKRFMGSVRERSPKLFVHWQLGLGSKAK